MSVVRPESRTSQVGGRRRSNTAQSVFRNPPVVTPTPLRFGDSKLLTAWVHDPKESPAITINPIWWPGMVEGDLLHVSHQRWEESKQGFLFLVPRDEGNIKHQLQISIPRPTAEQFGVKNSGEIKLTKVNPKDWGADHVELVFQDQYLGRNEMWRLERHLVGQCLYVEQDISFIGVIAAKVNAIYIRGKKVSAACVTPQTKVIFRSLSAKVTIFIQVCKELWEFSSDGERYYEKIVHSFLPTLFTKWKEAATTHIVTIVLISRVHYDEPEIDYAAGPIRKDAEERWYKDFFKVITDLEVIHDWKPTLVSLKDSFWDFQRDILLAHHHHRDPGASPDQANLIGEITQAHDGPILEALNLGFNPTETHYIDRSLSLTGSATIIITPGTGYFRVDKQLLRLTTTRMLDQGFPVDLVALTKPPLHQSPVFCFRGFEPDLRSEHAGKSGARASDPLWGGDAPMPFGKEKSLFWWEPFWMSVSFWDKQMDLPFREDRFVARARMHEIEMLGLLEHDVLSNNSISWLPDPKYPGQPVTIWTDSSRKGITKEEADAYDMEVFTPKNHPRIPIVSRNSVSSSTSGSAGSSSLPLKRSLSNRVADNTRIPPIQEGSPHKTLKELPQEHPAVDSRRLSIASTTTLSTSPSRTSILSTQSEHMSKEAGDTTSTAENSLRQASTRPASKSFFSPGWLFSPFRTSNQGQPSQASTSIEEPKAQTQPPTKTSTTSNTIRTSSTSAQLGYRPPKPMNIKNPSVGRSGLTRYGDDNLHPHRASFPRNSPVGTPPREITFGKRRSGTISSGIMPQAPSSSPALRTNPLKPTISVPYTASSLAQRWQHIFAQSLSKHNIKWKAMVVPGCLPLTVEYFPPSTELESSYDMHSYDFVIDPLDMSSFLVRPPSVNAHPDAVRRAWALVVMRGMVALRLAQGFQFVLRSASDSSDDDSFAQVARRSTAYIAMDDATPKPLGAAEVLRSPDDPIYLSMSNEIHRISFKGDTVHVRRYVRRMPRSQPFKYECLIWPKLGVGYTELSTTFVSQGLENYGWNRLDMLVAGYENQFSESLRYWRTRFLVIPSDDAPSVTSIGPAGEKLNEEEIRLLGMDKLADLFSKIRWVAPDDRGKPLPPVRFLPTDLDPVASVLDEALTARLDEIHALGPLKKKMKSEREISEMSLSAIAKVMREEDGVPIKDHRWHGTVYANSFTGSDFVSWLVREFRDISNREQAVERGAKLQEQGLFEHCRGAHGFLDGHYFYTLRGEYIIAMTPRSGGWFRPNRHATGEEFASRTHPPGGTRNLTPGRKNRKRLLLSQSMVIDIDPNKRSDQAESVVLHHDIIHNPATCFHFELQWVGTTARCIDDVLRQWSRSIERYGLKLVEGYVSQISDIRDRNPFQSCCPIPLVVEPPYIPDLEERVPEGTQTSNYFESALLRRFGFVLDIEAGNLYPDQVDVVYSYRRAPFLYSQWVHRTGVAFVQVLGGSEGYLFLTNRLMLQGRINAAPSSKVQKPASIAEDLRIELLNFCNDPKSLRQFYDDEIGRLGRRATLEEPPPLHL